MSRTQALRDGLRTHFNLQSLKTKGLTLLIEHGPCCILSFGAAMVGVSFLAHNPLLELGFAIGGALVGEHIGHKLFHKHTGAHEQGGHHAPPHSRLRRYGLALAFGLASWGVHQLYFHDRNHDDHAHDTPAAISAPHAAHAHDDAHNAPCTDPATVHSVSPQWKSIMEKRYRDCLSAQRR